MVEKNKIIAHLDLAASAGYGLATGLLYAKAAELFIGSNDYNSIVANFTIGTVLGSASFFAPLAIFSSVNHEEPKNPVVRTVRGISAGTAGAIFGIPTATAAIFGAYKLGIDLSLIGLTGGAVGVINIAGITRGVMHITGRKAGK